MTKTRQEIDARNADNRGVIANEIVERSKVANDVLGPIILASLMSSVTPPITATQGTAGAHSMPREASVDDLLADPMMSAVWRADAITETDVRNLVADVTDRLKGRNRLCRPSAELTARCA
jgi:hypothetical protein